MLSTLFDLTGRTALITGGSKGIGKAIARGFAEAGANVVISARHEDELKRAAAEGSSLGIKCANRVPRRRYEPAEASGRFGSMVAGEHGAREHSR